MTEESFYGHSGLPAVSAEEIAAGESRHCRDNNINNDHVNDVIDNDVLTSSLQNDEPVIDISKVVGKKSWVDTSSRKGLIGLFTTLPQMWKVLLAVVGFMIAVITGVFTLGVKYNTYDSNVVRKTDATFVSAASASDLAKWDSCRIISIEKDIQEIRNGQTLINSKIDKVDVR